jgi:hypothetical protein
VNKIKSNKYLFIGVSFSILGFIYILLITSHYNLGVTTDSVTYLSVSQNISNGKGLTFDGKFMTFSPPIYPIILSLTSTLLKADHLAVSKYLSAILLFAAILLINLIFINLKVNFRTTFILNLLLITSPAFSVYLMVWSEPLFISFLLLWYYLTFNWIKYNNRWFLFASGIISGLLIFTRYAGIGFTGGFILYLFFKKEKNIKIKIANLFSYISVLVSIFCFWIFFTLSLSSNPTGRVLKIHLINLYHIKSFVQTMASWMSPLFYKYSFIIIFILIAILLIVNYKKVREIFLALVLNEKNKILILTAISYLIFLPCSITLFDNSTPLDNRILAPLFPILLILAIPFIEKITHNRFLYLIPLVLLLISYIANFYISSKKFYFDGSNYTGKIWADSDTMKYLRNNHYDGSIFTNGGDVLRLLYSKDNIIYNLPFKFNPVDQMINNDFQKEMAALKDSVVLGKSILAYFNNITWRNYYPEKELLLNTFKENSFKVLKDGFVIERTETKPLN